MSFMQIVRARPALYKISRFIAIDRIRSLPLIICMIANIYERVEMAETTLGVAARRGTHVGATRTRVRVPTCRRESYRCTYTAVVCCRSITFLTRAVLYRYLPYSWL